MKKQYLDNAYKNVLLGQKEIFTLALPIAILYKYMFSQNEAILNEK